MIRDILKFSPPFIDRINDIELNKLVDQLLKLNDEKAGSKLQTKTNQLQDKIDYCENRINEIVNQLYSLT
jgi:hypothetical protein